MNISEPSPAGDPCQITIRLAGAHDLEAINDIYNHYVLHSTCTFQLDPDSPERRRAWLEGHGPEHPVTVAEAGGQVVGWGSLNRYHPREAYARTVENSIYVHHAWRRRGVGRALLEDLIARARDVRHHTMLACISADQAGSIALHEAHGFQQAAHLRELGWKQGQWLDVVLLQLLL